MFNHLEKPECNNCSLHIYSLDLMTKLIGLSTLHPFLWLWTNSESCTALLLHTFNIIKPSDFKCILEWNPFSSWAHHKTSADSCKFHRLHLFILLGLNCAMQIWFWISNTAKFGKKKKKDILGLNTNNTNFLFVFGQGFLFYRDYPTNCCTSVI